MNNSLNYNLNFKINNDNKVIASINKMEAGFVNIDKAIVKVDNAFLKTINNINNNIKTLKLGAIIGQISNIVDGINSLNAPGMNLSTSMHDLSAMTGIASDKLREVEKHARLSAKTFGGSAADAVESYKLILGQLAPTIADSPEALGLMGKSVQTLAKTMDGDTVGATEALTTAMNQYGISFDNPIQAAYNMEKMMNVMTAAAAEGSAELPQLKAALEQAGMAAKAANVSFEETNSAIEILDAAGRKGSEGGIALRNVLSTLSQGRFLPKDVKEELAVAGVSVKSLTDKNKSLAERLESLKPVMKDSALMGKLFGRANASSAMALIGSTDAMKGLTLAVTDTNAAYEQAAIIMESPLEKNARIKASIDDFKISLFNATDGLMGYASVLGDTARDVSNLIPLIAAMGSVLSFITSKTKMQALWTTIVTGATTLWTGAQWLLNIALTANPIGVIIVAIGVLIGIIGYLIYKIDGWGEAWKHVVNGSKLIFKLFIDDIKWRFNSMVDALVIGLNYIKEGWYNFRNAVGIGDKNENNKMLSAIHADTEARKTAIVDGLKNNVKTALEAANEFKKAGQSLSWNSDGSIQDVLSPKVGAGISSPIIPGTVNGFGVEGSESSKTGKKTNEAIATGGTKHNYVTITMKDLIGVLNIQGKDFKESAKQMEEQTVDSLLRILSTATTAGS